MTERRVVGLGEWAVSTPEELAQFTMKVVDALEAVDGEDQSMLYVQSFVIAESGVPVRLMRWHEDRWQELLLDDEKEEGDGR